jgi:hypothetical protein
VDGTKAPSPLRSFGALQTDSLIKTDKVIDTLKGKLYTLRKSGQLDVPDLDQVNPQQRGDSNGIN